MGGNTMIGWHKKKGGSASQALKPSELALETERSCRFAGYGGRAAGGNVAASQRGGRRP